MNSAGSRRDGDGRLLHRDQGRGDEHPVLLLPRRAQHSHGNTGRGGRGLRQAVLRGTWWTNPYREDGAPTGAWNYYTRTQWFGGVPRGWRSGTLPGNTSLLGGWQIDQNNSNPTVSGGYTGVNWTMANSAGLCLLCHGSTSIP